MRTDAEIYDLTTPLIAKLASASVEASRAVSGGEGVEMFPPADLRKLNALADELVGATSGFDLFVAERTRGLIGGPAISRFEAENAFPLLPPAARTLWVAVGFWSDLLNHEARMIDEVAARKGM